jgi:hypothetical protein
VKAGTRDQETKWANMGEYTEKKAAIRKRLDVFLLFFAFIVLRVR